MEKEILTTLEYLDQKAEKESKMLLKKNKFILNVLNTLGQYLNPNYIIIKEFDIEANLTSFMDLMDNFCINCSNSKVKELSIRLISFLILQIIELNESYEKIINELMQIVLKENYLMDQQNVLKLYKLTEKEFKKILKNEQNDLISNFNKLFGINVIEILVIMVNILSTDNLNLLFFILEKLEKNIQV